MLRMTPHFVLSSSAPAIRNSLCSLLSQSFIAHVRCQSKCPQLPSCKHVSAASIRPELISHVFVHDQLLVLSALKVSEAHEKGDAVVGV